ncbi:hypothetical protein KFK09_026908 [Dendrobium nobile]|uniref:Uncharacterized protein n=1 Tax=Dendrobium nobile TaxID=94219 RepID=A0A8T3AA08_DENNO|nr:hypothetical protein KFK09_026908 [Dendrobium nobile]
MKLHVAFCFVRFSPTSLESFVLYSFYSFFAFILGKRSYGVMKIYEIVEINIDLCV